MSEPVGQTEQQQLQQQQAQGTTGPRKTLLGNWQEDRAWYETTGSVGTSRQAQAQLIGQQDDVREFTTTNQVSYQQPQAPTRVPGARRARLEQAWRQQAEVVETKAETSTPWVSTSHSAFARDTGAGTAAQENDTKPMPADQVRQYLHEPAVTMYSQARKDPRRGFFATKLQTEKSPFLRNTQFSTPVDKCLWTDVKDE